MAGQRIKNVAKETAGREPRVRGLRDSVKCLKILFESAPDAYFIYDFKGNFIDGNKALEEITGYKKEEIIGKSLFRMGLLSPEQTLKVAMLLAKNVQGKPTGPTVYILTRKDGCRVVVEIRTRPVNIQGQTLVLAIAHDITERKKAEEELSASEKRFRFLSENSIDLIYTLDLNGHYTYVSPSVEKLFGYTVPEALALRPQDIMTPESYQRQFDALNKVLQESVDYSLVSQILELELIRKDGSIIWGEINARLITNDDGVPVSILGIARDITERKRAEDALRKINACFLSFGPDSLQNIKLITQSAGEILEATCALYNRREGELIITLAGWQLPDDLPPSDKGQGHICFDVIKKGGEEPLLVRDLQNTKYAKTDPNVKKYDLKTYLGYPVKVAGQPVASLCAVYQSDIKLYDFQLKLLQMLGKAASVEEERRQAKEELVKAKNYTENVINSMTDTLIVVSPQAAIQKVNRATLELLGYQEEELVGQPIGKILEEETTECQGKEIRRGFVRNYNANLKTRLGELIPVSINDSVIREGSGKIVGTVLIARDVRADLKVQAQLIQAEKMAVAGQLGAGIAHEINNPLGSILGFTQLLLGEVPAGDPKRKDLQKIESAALRCKKTIESMLEFSRPAKTRFDYVDLNKIIEDAVSLFGQGNKTRTDIKIFKELPKPLPRILGNANQLEQVFINILVNAKNALAKGGWIRVSTKLGDKNIEIKLANNGPRISQKYLSRIFEPFFSLPKVSDADSTGLGLSISRQIVENHGGLIEVRNGRKRGVMFRIKLPF